jgi:hypothetical protein
VVPAVAGSALGALYRTRTSRAGSRWVRWLLTADRERWLLDTVLGTAPAPRAWDDLFSQRRSMYLRIHTTDGVVLAGRFGSLSYAATFPNEPDLLLQESWATDENDELVRSQGYPVYIAAGQIARLEIVQPQEPGRGA